MPEKERRMQMLGALNKAAIRFLSQDETNFVQKMTAGVDIIAEIAQVDRVSIWRNFDRNGMLHTAQIYRWAKDSGGTTEPLPALKDIDYRAVAPDWIKGFSAGESLNGPLRLLPDSGPLKKLGVLSVFANPIFVDDTWWGFALFSDCHNERVFGDDETDILNTASLMMANTVKRHEDTLKTRDMDERARLMLDATPLVCQLWNEKNETIDCNEAAPRLYGLKSKQEYIERFFDLSPEFQPDGRRSDEKARACIQIAFDKGRHSFEWMHQLPDGTPLPAELTLVRVTYGGKDVIAAYQRDLRNEKRMMREIKDALAAAESANHAKSEFLSRMSHEIRTPMNAILGFTEIILQNETLSPDVRESLHKIANSGNLLVGIINDILDLAKIESGKLELHPARYDVTSLINDSIQLNVMRIESKPVEFRIDISETMPARLLGDELRIKQILNNLLSNAFKYTAEGAVTLTATYANNELVFTVSDTGQGMTAEQLERLYDKYTRFNPDTNRAVEGTGLGMNITRSLVELMNGRIAVTSAPGKGTTAVVHLPQPRIDDEVLGAELVENLRHFRLSAAAHRKSAQITYEPMPYGRILIVDDVETNLFVAKGLLALYSLTIETAHDAQTAIDKVKNGAAYDIIFMDQMMPGMDGITATKILRNLGYTCPIVALTANAVAGNAELFLSNGFDGFISKPIDIRQLDAAVHKYVRARHKNCVTTPPFEIVKQGAKAAAGANETDGSCSDLSACNTQADAPQGQSNTARGNAPGIRQSHITSPERASQSSETCDALSGLEKSFIHLPGALPRAGMDQAVGLPIRRHSHHMQLPPAAAGLSPELASAFIRDADKALAVLEAHEADLSAYTVTVHGLKSALANIGETELSATARKLEQAARDRDTELIKNETQKFSAALITVVEKIKAALRAQPAQAGDDDDLKTAFAKLREACAGYDKKAAKDALAPLKNKTWPPDIQARLDAINKCLLHSDFDEVRKLIAT